MYKDNAEYKTAECLQSVWFCNKIVVFQEKEKTGTFNVFDL